MTPTDIRLQVRDNGWSPVPVKGKRPVLKEWERFCRSYPTDEEIYHWERLFPGAPNTGIALGRQVCIDIDVGSDELLARQIRAEAVECFGSTPFVRVGRAPRVALIYQAAEPLATKHFKAASGNGDGVDILSDGTQCVAFGTHPDTGRLYQWVGEASPLDACPDDAPAVTNAQLEEFLDRVNCWMPLVGSSSKGAPRSHGNRSAHQIVRDTSGLVVDGREEFLRACVWRAASSLKNAHEVLTADAVAALAWSFFTDPVTGASLRDGRWTEKHALEKARGTVRRIRDGKVELRLVQQSIKPTYPDNSKPIEEVREALRVAMHQHFEKEDEFWRKRTEAMLDHNDEADDIEVPVSAVRVTTGAGKSTTAVELIAERVKERDAQIAGTSEPKRDRARPRRYGLLAPTLRLAEQLATKCRALGLSAEVFRGREADDPEQPDQKMCHDLAAVEMAFRQGEAIEESCCSKKQAGHYCAFYSVCGYQKQKRHNPTVWAGAHTLMYHQQTGLGSFDGLIIDESFWASGLWTEKLGLTVEQIRETDIVPFDPARLYVQNDFEYARHKMARAIERHQEQEGGIRREHLHAEYMKPDDCTNANRAEWFFKEDNPFWPGMPKEQRKAAAERAEMAKYVRPFSQMWQGAKELLLYQEVADAVSGRVFLKKNDNNELVLLTRGVSSIPKQWQIPTLIMDATLPEQEILQAFFPTVEVLANIEAEMPHVTVRQVVWAPVSSRKLQPAENGPTENMLAICRAILWRYIEVGRKPTLVITQKNFALWLRASGLPDGVSVEWFNNVAGLDHYKDVRLVIAIGRTLPDVFTVEALAGALTGLEPFKAPEQKNGTRWYNRVALGARLRDGSGVKVESDRHPDPMVEAVRWQICEKEVLQAIGRGRPTNRCAETPLDIDIMIDEVLPITVDRVMTWDQIEDGLEIRMLIEGVYLDSPTDMAACWPDVWITANAAECWQRRARLTGRRRSYREAII